MEPIICGFQTSTYPHGMAEFGAIANIGNLVATALNYAMNAAVNKYRDRKFFSWCILWEYVISQVHTSNL